ncbi:MAG: hypothetical protein EON57_00045 [Alphaproteobacteria bacterium]|nr:MAG: hypothetical protein EON57_00045 [Alphaproteobacteria bacterium]
MEAAEMVTLFPYECNAYCDLRALGDARKLVAEEPLKAEQLTGTLWLLDEASKDNDQETALELENGRVGALPVEKKWQRLIPGLKAGMSVASLVRKADPRLSVRYNLVPSSNQTIRDVFHNRTHDLSRFSGELTSLADGTWFEYDLSIHLRKGRIVRTEVRATPSIFR